MAIQASLVYEADDGNKSDLALDAGVKSTIGRHPQCTLFVNQPSVSRRHARVWYDGQSWIVEDLKSSNGTFVNNQRIEREELNEGDEVRCGDFKITFLMEEFTQEVGDIAPTPSAPRLVGALRSQASIPPADPQVVSRPTIGIADAFPSQATDLGNGAGSHLQDATIAELEKQLEEFRHQVANLENLNEELKSKNTSLEARHAEEAAALTEAQARESALREELEESRKALDANEQGPNLDEFIDELSEIYEDLDVYTSETNLKLRLSRSFIDDITAMGAFLESLRNDPDAQGPLGQKIKAFVDEADADKITRMMLSSIDEAQKATRSNRRIVRLLKEVLKPHLER
ncbi:MAG: FHA domain-containing protein [Bradymonadia bacterium]